MIIPKYKLTKDDNFQWITQIHISHLFGSVEMSKQPKCLNVSRYLSKTTQSIIIFYTNL